MSRLSRRARLLIVAGAVVVVLGAAAAIVGPLVYKGAVEAGNDTVPTLEPSSSVEGAGEELDDAVLSGTWTVVEGSEAGYRVDEVLNGTDVTVTGRTDQVEGTVESDGTALTAATVTVDVASIATDEPARDSYFRETAMQTASHPDATFELTQAVASEETPTVGGVQTVTATGLLTMHGVTNEVTADIQVQFTDAEGGVRIAGSIPVTFSDYGVEAPSLGFVTVEDAGSVEFDLTLERS